MPLEEPLRVRSPSLVIIVKGDLLTLSKPKSEVLGALGIMAKDLYTL